MTKPIDTHPALTTWAASLFAAVATGLLLWLTEPGRAVRASVLPALGAGVGVFVAMTLLRRRRASRREPESD